MRLLRLKRKINVSIIVLDTMRLDTFNGLVGKSKLLDRFDLVRFERCIAPASWTLPSHASMFTGLYPSEHGSHETKRYKSLDIEHVKLRMDTIVDDLKEMGYTAYGISANPYVHPIYGFDRFDRFFEESYFTDISGSTIEVSNSLKPMLAKYRNEHDNDVMALSRSIIREDPKLFLDLAVSAAALSPIAAAKKAKARLLDGWPIEKGGRNTVKRIRGMALREPFFLFVNIMEAHDPYSPRKEMNFNWATPFRKGKIDRMLVKRSKEGYLKGSQRALRYAAEIMSNLVERFGDDQLIILTSDHGQAFNEHGFIGHGTVLFDEVIKVPLAVMAPKSLSKKGKSGYQSLANIRKFVNSAISGDKNALSELSSNETYSETFSIPANISNAKDMDGKKLARFDKYQKRVFR